VLIFTRKKNQSFWIGDQIKITITDIEGPNKVRVGIDAPADVAVHREEIKNKIEGNQS
jgi:carbon storage regulator